MELLEISNTSNNQVVKHNDLVRKARYSLSETGIKVVSCLIAMVHKGDVDFQEYHLRIADFKALTGSSSENNYQLVDNVTNELMKNPFKIGDEKFNWCYYAKYAKGDGHVVLKIAPELKPHLLALQEGNFTKYYIENILKLKSAYVIRLYEMFIDKLNNAKKYKQKCVFELKIDDLKELFEIPPTYQYSSHIKALIIDKAKKQFKEKTDIQFSYTEQKIGRRVDRLIITVRENDKGSNDFLATEKAFISYIRKNYANVTLLTIDKNFDLSASKDGLLYNQKEPNSVIPPKKSKELWAMLYNLAKEDKLYCLKQGTLDFSEPKPIITDSNFSDLIGKMLEGRNVIEKITKSGDVFIVDTPIGEYKFSTIDQIRSMVKY